MSDNEEGTKKSGYRLEYASSARAKCKGPKPCNGTKIEKGELRFGSLVDFKGNTTFSWRHWGCVTTKIFSNMKEKFDAADDLDGFEDLKEDDQEKIRTAWEAGKVAEEDIPESAQKADGEGDEEEEDGAGKKKAKKADGPAKFKLEYAASGRAKCKGGCDENIGKDYLRLGHEVDFRGNKSLAWQHWGCAPVTIVAKIKQSYTGPEEIEGYSELKEAEQEKVKRAWEEGAIPEEDQGPGEPVVTEKKKKAPAKRTKKVADDDDEESEKPPKKRARKAPKPAEDDEDEDEKPKAKRQATKKAPAKAPAKKRAPKKKQESEDESVEDFGAEIDAISAEEEEEDDEPKPKPKRKAPAASKKASAPPSKKAAKPSSSKPSSRRKKAVESDDEDYD